MDGAKAVGVPVWHFDHCSGSLRIWYARAFLTRHLACDDPSHGRQSRMAPDSRRCAALFPDIAMYDWFPIVFIVFKVVVLGTGMYFAIKWHHDQAKQDARDAESRAREDAAVEKERDDAP